MEIFASLLSFYILTVDREFFLIFIVYSYTNISGKNLHRKTISSAEILGFNAIQAEIGQRL